MPVILFHGDNLLEIGDAVRKARAPFHPADIITLDGPTAQLSTLAEASLTAGLFDPERLVIVHQLHDRFKGSRKDGPESAEIERLFTRVAPTTTLLLVADDMPPDHQLAMQVRAAGGTVKQFNIPRKQELPRWIVARAGQHRVSIDHAAAELLAELIGNNPVMLESELEKLATYAGAEERVTPAMVDALVGAVPQESIFALVDAIAAGNRAVAYRLLHAQLTESSSGPIDVALYLIRMLARQVRILLGIRLGQEAGRSTSQLTVDLKLSRYYADRYFRQARRLSGDQLTAAFELLARLEFGLKSGRADATTGLDLLVAELSR